MTYDHVCVVHVLLVVSLVNLSLLIPALHFIHL
jgi:hypothetical protein